MSEVRVKTKAQLDPIFSPQSVAVIGATDQAGTVPYDILANLVRDKFQGPVYPVSPGKLHIDSIKSYKYVVDIQDPVDLAILVFPSSVCHLALDQCGQKGVKAAVIISAGFKEVGGEGLQREKRLKEIAAKYDISFIGPNCLGVINTDPRVRLDASFARKMPDPGNIGFLSQSGALCTAVLDYAQARHIGFSKFVSFGNKADISDIDLLYYLSEDEQTKVILMYLEEVSDGIGLMKAARDIISKTSKPVLILKSGRSPRGAAAAVSHTGSLAGSDEVCDAAMRQAGIIRCRNIDEMFNNAIALAYQPLPKSDRIAIVTNAGGPGVLATDATYDEGIRMAEFGEDTTKLFKRSLPVTANIKNPVDVIGDARSDRYEVALAGALADGNVDGVAVILTPQSMTNIEEIAQSIVKKGHGASKPVYASFMGEADVKAGIGILQRNRIPHYSLPESMCKAFATAWRFQRTLQRDHTAPAEFTDVSRDKAKALLDKALAEGRHHLPEEEAEAVLATYGLPIIPSSLANSADQAAAFAQQIGFPVVMKIVSEEIVHKVDVGGVVLNVGDAAAAKAAYEAIVGSAQRHKPDARIKGVLVQKMLKGGEEVILGLKRDPSFGPVAMFGLGGSFVEVFKDVSFRVCPLNTTSISRMVKEIKAYPILSGARGRKRRDVAAIEQCIQRLSQMAVECPEIQELDINPLIVMNEGEGCFLADARIML
jgi:acetyltransferase